MINFSTFSFAIIPCAPDNSEFIANNADCFFSLLLNLTIFYLDDDWFKEQKQKIKKLKTKKKMKQGDKNFAYSIKYNQCHKLETQQSNRMPHYIQVVCQMPFVSAWLACFRFGLWGGVNCHCCGFRGEQGQVIILLASYDFWQVQEYLSKLIQNEDPTIYTDAGESSMQLYSNKFLLSAEFK